MDWAMPAPRKLGKDPGLQARMALTLFLLGALYVVLIVALLAAGTGAVLVAVIAGGLLLAQFVLSHKLAPHAMSAREVPPAQAPELHLSMARRRRRAHL